MKKLRYTVALTLASHAPSLAFAHGDRWTAAIRVAGLLISSIGPGLAVQAV